MVSIKIQTNLIKFYVNNEHITQEPIKISVSKIGWNFFN